MYLLAKMSCIQVIIEITCLSKSFDCWLVAIIHPHQMRLLNAWWPMPSDGSGTPRPKTISAQDSSAQIDFFTGTPRPGTPRPSYKNMFLWHKWKISVYLVVFFISI